MGVFAKNEKEVKIFHLEVLNLLTKWIFSYLSNGFVKNFLIGCELLLTLT